MLEQQPANLNHIIYYLGKNRSHITTAVISLILKGLQVQVYIKIARKKANRTQRRDLQNSPLCCLQTGTFLPPA